MHSIIKSSLVTRLTYPPHTLEKSEFGVPCGQEGSDHTFLKMKVSARQTMAFPGCVFSRLGDQNSETFNSILKSQM